MRWLNVFFAAGILVSGVYCADDTIAWCYHLPTCNYTTWPTIAANFCNRSRQSPIDIDTNTAEVNESLNAFTFTNYDSDNILDIIINTGKTVKVNFKTGARVSGGGLSEPYDGLQFHLHWGNGRSSPGAEHTVNGVRHPMELHIVNVKSSLNLNTTAAVNDPTGLAALGFFIVERENTSSEPEGWRKLTSYLKDITEQGQNTTITESISLNDLLVGVDRSQYYRYLGSLTTPNCNEAVVWTVFKDPIEVSADLIDMFGTTVRIGNETSPLMRDVYRGIQPRLAVTQTQTRNETDSSPTNFSGITMCISLALIALTFILGNRY
ncbi:carbonic anhydrase XVb [Corythoichthys intestinalis]|uniref:carbonic anhydrase XVb n=1 Tax=Corythoichthys intestinalis TaxID=161448 RepID=UPI0025A5E7EB|nr:carbonic anhydrase XVb [Corythoichthys intestinalis]XP_061807661.1 carbonic anhydrase 4-like [Nerophis lumbriciformis]